MSNLEQQPQSCQTDVMLRFSSVDDDSAKALVIDYYAVKWLNDNGYYKDGHLNEQYGTAPILTAVKWAERQLNTTDAQLLLNLLEKRVSQMQQHNVSSSSGVIRQERGWAGHFICAKSCWFRRNTLLTYNDIRIVVSTVGLMEIDGKFETIGHNRHFETMAFHSDPNDKRYYDANVSKQVYFDSDWAIAEQDADDKANEMHEAVVSEITNRLLAGDTFPVTEW